MRRSPAAALVLAGLLLLSTADAGAQGGPAPGSILGSPDVSTGDEAIDTPTLIQVQQMLRAAGFDPGTTSGVMDQRTQEAILRYQRAKGLRPTGRLDAQTRAALSADAR
jgi:peptidoglycan hydrolase-like protein with peptidoglycan-binding domain